MFLIIIMIIINKHWRATIFLALCSPKPMMEVLLVLTCHLRRKLRRKGYLTCSESHSHWVAYPAQSASLLSQYFNCCTIGLARPQLLPPPPPCFCPSRAVSSFLSSRNWHYWAPSPALCRPPPWSFPTLISAFFKQLWAFNEGNESYYK